MTKDAATIVKEHGQMEAELALLRPQLAALKGDSTKLVTGATLPTDLVSAGNAVASLTGNLATANASVNALTGDKTKLTAGASLPTDLVSAGNSIFALTTERDLLKTEKTTTEQAVAVKLAELGIHKPEAKTATSETTKAPVFNPDAAILAARGVATLAELNQKFKNGEIVK